MSYTRSVIRHVDTSVAYLHLLAAFQSDWTPSRRMDNSLRVHRSPRASVPQRNALIRRKVKKPLASRRTCEEELEQGAEAFIRNDAAETLHDEVVVGPPQLSLIARNPINETVHRRPFRNKAKQVVK